MSKFLILVFLAGQAYGSTSIGGRIFNGTDAQEGEYPFAANLRFNNFDNITNLHQCGVSILNKNFVLTAAHCFNCLENGTATYGPDEFNIQYGLVNITTDATNSINLSKIYCNNLTIVVDGDFYEYIYDVAVVELATPLPDDGSWAPVTLARDLDATVQQKGLVIGWGYLDEDLTPAVTLQKFTLDVYNDTVCGAATRGNWDHHVCVGWPGYGGPCWGDSGTAALIDGIQVGVTSYMTLTSDPPMCGHANETSPTVYARVDKYLDWILSITPDVLIQ